MHSKKQQTGKRRDNSDNNKKNKSKRRTTKVSRQNVNNIENYVKVEEGGGGVNALGRQCGTGDTRRWRRNGTEVFKGECVCLARGRGRKGSVTRSPGVLIIN